MLTVSGGTTCWHCRNAADLSLRAGRAARPEKARVDDLGADNSSDAIDITIIAAHHVQLSTLTLGQTSQPWPCSAIWWCSSTHGRLSMGRNCRSRISRKLLTTIQPMSI